MIPSNYTFPKPTNKGNFSKSPNGDVFFSGFLYESKYINQLTINEKISLKSILINL